MSGVGSAAALGQAGDAAAPAPTTSQAPVVNSMPVGSSNGTNDVPQDPGPNSNQALATVVGHTAESDAELYANHRRRHNEVEQRRRQKINDCISDLEALLPASHYRCQASKAYILSACIAYIQEAQLELVKLKDKLKPNELGLIPASMSNTPITANPAVKGTIQKYNPALLTTNSSAIKPQSALTSTSPTESATSHTTIHLARVSGAASGSSAALATQQPVASPQPNTGGAASQDSSSQKQPAEMGAAGATPSSTHSSSATHSINTTARINIRASPSPTSPSATPPASTTATPAIRIPPKNPGTTAAVQYPSPGVKELLAKLPPMTYITPTAAPAAIPAMRPSMPIPPGGPTPVNNGSSLGTAAASKPNSLTSVAPHSFGMDHVQVKTDDEDLTSSPPSSSREQSSPPSSSKEQSSPPSSSKEQSSPPSSSKEQSSPPSSSKEQGTGGSRSRQRSAPVSGSSRKRIASSTSRTEAPKAKKEKRSPSDKPSRAASARTSSVRSSSRASASSPVKQGKAGQARGGGRRPSRLEMMTSGTTPLRNTRGVNRGKRAVVKPSRFHPDSDNSD